MAVKKGGSSVMMWCCFAASGPGHFAVVNKTNKNPKEKCLPTTAIASVDLQLKQ